MIVARECASLRIDIGGGVTDIPEIGKEVGTCVTNFALDLYSDDTYQQRRQLELVINQKKEGETIFIYNDKQESLNQTDSDDELHLIKSTIRIFQQMHPLRNIYEFKVSDDLPKRTGLGGSAGLSVCLNMGLTRIAENEKGVIYNPDANKVLREAHHMEVGELNIKGGFQDFIGAFFGNVNLINFPTLQSVDLANYPSLGIPMEPSMKNYLNEHMLILLSRKGNINSSLVVSDEISQQRQNPAEINPRLEDIKQHNAEIYQLLTMNSNLMQRLTNLGGLINESWKLQKGLSPLVAQARLSSLEQMLLPHVYGLRGPGAGVNSLFLLMKPDSKQEILSTIAPYVGEIEIIFAKVNEEGARKSKISTRQ